MQHSAWVHLLMVFGSPPASMLESIRRTIQLSAQKRISERVLNLARSMKPRPMVSARTLDPVTTNHRRGTLE